MKRKYEVADVLTPKGLDHFIQNVISAFNYVQNRCYTFAQNWSDTMNIQSALWILVMAWCFSTRASIATVLSANPCVSRCLRVKPVVRDLSTYMHCGWSLCNNHYDSLSMGYVMIWPHVHSTNGAFSYVILRTISQSPCTWLTIG